MSINFILNLCYYSTGRCLSDLQNDIELQQIWREMVGCMNLNITCDEHYQYRSADGSCNNLVFPEWGQAFTPQIRFVEAHYEDGMYTLQYLFLDESEITAT